MTFGFEQGLPTLDRELKTRHAEVREWIESTLASGTAASFETPGENLELREELKEGTNGQLKIDQIQEIYFTEFVVSPPG